MDFVFITDTHFTSSSRVRTGDLLEDCMSKLRFVVDYCNNNNCILLHGGDFCDKPAIPDFVKSQIFQELRRLNTACYVVLGNHDLLYNNEDYLYKTSYNTFVSAGVINDLSGKTIDLGDCFITNEVPIKTMGKPVIAISHAFLNQEDGKNTFRFTDIQSTDNVYICLGHDHVEYEPLQYKPNIKIFRPGSFLRGIRNDTQYRQPKLLHIKADEKGLHYKLVEIKARDFNEIFKEKDAKISQVEKKQSYDDIISQIRNAQNVEMSFESAVKSVADPIVFEFIFKSLNQANLEKLNKRQNL